MKNISFIKSSLNGYREIKSYRGLNLKINILDERSKDADIIEISRDLGRVYLTKENDMWTSSIWETGKGFARYILKKNRVNYSLEVEFLSREKGESIIDAEAHKIKAEAESVISWCDPKDENEKSGRYWINAYHGAGVYRLIVLDGKIKGSIYGGFHDCNRSLNTVVAGYLSFKRAIEEIIEEKLGTDKFQMLKADGSGTSFFLRNPEDKKFLKTKEYEVPSAQGGMHQNIEIV